MNCGKRDTVINGTAQLEGELVAGEYNWCRGADGEFKNIKAGWCAYCGQRHVRMLGMPVAAGSRVASRRCVGAGDGSSNRYMRNQQHIYLVSARGPSSADGFELRGVEAQGLQLPLPQLGVELHNLGVCRRAGEHGAGVEDAHQRA